MDCTPWGEQGIFTAEQGNSFPGRRAAKRLLLQCGWSFEEAAPRSTDSLDDRLALDSPALGIELIAALHHLYMNDFKIDATLSMVGSRRTLEEVKSGVEPNQIVADWQPELENFRILRARYLLY